MICYVSAHANISSVYVCLPFPVTRSYAYRFPENSGLATMLVVWWYTQQRVAPGLMSGDPKIIQSTIWAFLNAP